MSLAQLHPRPYLTIRNFDLTIASIYPMTRTAFY